jgi:NitT/TauT family transport system substrate-binding protein
MQRTWVIMVLASLALVGGCKKEESSSGGGKPGPWPKAVRVGYFANLTHAQVVLGIASGEFAKAVEPAELTAKVFNAGPALMEAFAAGEIDVGYVGPGPALNYYAVTHGEGVRVISGVAANGVVIVARKGSGIASVKDLAGKKIATPQHGNTQDIAARHYVTSVLGQKDHDNVIAVQNAEQAALMQRGEIDAAWVPEPWGARLVADAEGTIVGEEKDLWPGGQFSLTVVVTTPEFLRDHGDVVEKLLGVHRAWTKRLREDVAGQAGPLGEAMYKLTQKKLPAEVVKAALSRIVFTDDPLPATFKTMAQWSADLKFGPAVPRLDALFAMGK